MVIDDLDIEPVSVLPFEADAPLFNALSELLVCNDQTILIAVKPLSWTKLYVPKIDGDINLPAAALCALAWVRSDGLDANT